MDVFEHIDDIQERELLAGGLDFFNALEEELFQALCMYWTTAARILRGSGIKLMSPPAEYFSLESNFFSALFLYSYQRAKIPKPHRMIYASANQCLRGMVTGCDNILDNEYKKTLETDLPEHGTRFRSVLDIMVSDRVLFEIFIKHCENNGWQPGHVLDASAASLRALTRSGAQEATEEGGVVERLHPEKVLSDVHHYKTGLLFQCPWAIPATIEDLDKKTSSSFMEALYRIGMGCQIMDDMVDLAADVQEGRHNYVASLIFHDPEPGLWAHLQNRLIPRRIQSNYLSTDWLKEDMAALLFEFDGTRLAAAKKAKTFLESGLKALFEERFKHLVEPTMSFLAERIKADRFMSETDNH